ncbi:MAG: ABC transporter ATP-binding protein [Deltaproteobacteria bacterium]|nr:ABC transporter ATP-binding protein [Deltaproteobacteria bacterium]
MSKVVLKNIVKKYGDVFAVQKMDLAIDSGSFVSFLGPSGCGKTTTLRMVAGLSDPTDGEIHIGEKIVFNHSQKISLPAEKRNMGMVFQSYALWPHMTAFGNVAYPLKIQKKEKEEIETKVQTFLKMVHLEGLEKRYPHELSGGQQQRVALARALIREPEVLLLDEPLSNLDAKLRLSMRQEIKELQRRLKITTIYVTHDQEEAFTLSDVVILMNKGKVERMDSEFAKDFLAQHH